MSEGEGHSLNLHKSLQTTKYLSTAIPSFAIDTARLVVYVSLTNIITRISVALDFPEGGRLELTTRDLTVDVDFRIGIDAQKVS